MHSVSRKLTVLITASLVVIFATASWVNLKLQERAVTRILRVNGAQVADLVSAATRKGMLENDRERIQASIETLARQRSIERIRIIRKGGEIAYSTNPEEIGSFIDMKAEQCISCHERVVPPLRLPTEERARIVQRGENRILGITQTITNEAECTTACHAHAPEQPLLGVLDVNLALEPFDEAREISALEMSITSLIGVLLIIGVTVFSVHRLVRRPVRALIAETTRISAGDLSARVPEGSGDELGALARHFNRMARDLGTARAELLEWGATLERRVESKSVELKKAQEHIVQVEKMASLGKLAAVVAHEINNPLASVVTYAKTLVRRLRRQDELTDECRENLDYLESIASEASRCGEIVSELLSFAHRRGGEFAPIDLNQIVEKALFLVHHKLEMSGINNSTQLTKDLPCVVADADPILQALMALIINAIQAAEEPGAISISTRRLDEGVELVVADDGPGMPEQVARHAFEPFFTTKDKGEGVGLGLSVVYGIIERHGGHIALETKPGQGCRFTLYFPQHPPHVDQEDKA